MKICCRCKKQKESNSFCKNKSTKDGLNKMCRSCAKYQTLLSRQLHPERVKETIKNYSNVLRKNSFAILAIHADESGAYNLIHDYKNVSKLTVLGFLESMAAKIRVELVASYQQADMTQPTIESDNQQNYIG